MIPEKKCERCPVGALEDRHGAVVYERLHSRMLEDSLHKRKPGVGLQVESGRNVDGSRAPCGGVSSSSDVSHGILDHMSLAGE
jgi:hypothetical protein